MDARRGRDHRQAATGASPTYFDYDAFDEIQISTAGNDIRQPTGGVGLNFVVKRGTNNFRGGFKGYYTNDSIEATNIPDELRATGVTPETADHNDEIMEWGGDIGGPLIRDRLWFWGSYVEQRARPGASESRPFRRALRLCSGRPSTVEGRSVGSPRSGLPRKRPQWSSYTLLTMRQPSSNR
ncbi:MAG TPA: hypothetical protein VMO26_23910 [Vicinamibacterales bacterium]|nr:hypothetical protein [Vicinamibacterales bacterium]